MSELWYRLNMMGEKSFFENDELIDGIVVPAHLLAFYHNTLPNFLNDINLPFIIDPMTYVWNIDRSSVIKKNELKKSYQKYVELLNNPIASLLGNYQITQTSYSDDDFSNFVDSVLRFQFTVGGASADYRARSLRRIRSLTRGIGEEIIRPSMLIPPYFYFRSVDDITYNLNINSVQHAGDSLYSELSTIMPCLCMSQRILFNTSNIEQIITDFSDFDQILLWINNFDETKVDLDSLAKFRELVTNFNDIDVSVMNLYGAYFSQLLSYYGMNSASSGIGLSHRKEILSTATGGGMPLRYYEPTLKMEILTYSAFRLYTRHPELFLCNCPVCQPFSENINNYNTIREREEFLAPLFVDSINDWGRIDRKAIMDWRNTRLHFLYSKIYERDNLTNITITDIIKTVRDDYRYLSRNLNFGIYNFNSIDYLDRWCEAIE